VLREIGSCYFSSKLMAKWRWPGPVGAEEVGVSRYRRCRAKREQGESCFLYGEGPQSRCGKRRGSLTKFPTSYKVFPILGQCEWVGKYWSGGNLGQKKSCSMSPSNITGSFKWRCTKGVSLRIWSFFFFPTLKMNFTYKDLQVYWGFISKRFLTTKANSRRKKKKKKKGKKKKRRGEKKGEKP